MGAQVSKFSSPEISLYVCVVYRFYIKNCAEVLLQDCDGIMALLILSKCICIASELLYLTGICFNASFVDMCIVIWRFPFLRFLF